MADDEMADDDMAEEDEMADDDMAEGESTRFEVTLTNTSDGFAIAASGAQAVPFDGTEPGPAGPGSGYVFVVPRAAPRLSFATMFVQTNDWFWSPGPAGLALTDADGTPLAGDVTDQVSLWDAGTEVDQTPGEGADQAPRQAGPDTGDADPNTAIRPVDGFDAANYLTVTLDPQDDGSTVVRIENISAGASVPGPIAPVAWAVHTDAVSLFVEGAEATAGLEVLAEDGGAADLAAELAPLTGATGPFAPLAYIAAPQPDALFVPGEVASAGLETLAEDGGAADLVAELEAAGIGHFGAASIPDGESEAGPAFPGQTYTFTVAAGEGDYLNLASMLVQTNDWFVGLRNIALFEGGEPISGDLTDQLRLYDAGTEVDQPVGAGPDQAPRQAGPDTGAADENTEVRGLDFDLAGYLTVTIEPVG
jgi:hypothetical protein